MAYLWETHEYIYREDQLCVNNVLYTIGMNNDLHCIHDTGDDNQTVLANYRVGVISNSRYNTDVLFGEYTLIYIRYPRMCVRRKHSSCHIYL